MKRDAAPRHHYDAGAIDEAPFLVRPALEQLPGFIVERGIYVDDLDEGRRFYAFNGSDDRRANMTQRTCQKRDQFRNNVIRGYDSLVPVSSGPV